MNELRRRWLLILLTIWAGGVAGGQEKTSPPKKDDKQATESAKPKDVAIPDLHTLLRPGSELAAVVMRFEADRGSLQRFWSIPISPTRHARLGHFYGQWLGALKQLDNALLSVDGSKDLAKLHESVEKALKQLDEEARQQAGVAALLPFAPAIVRLEEGRRQLEQVEPMKTAGLLTELRKQIERLRKDLAAPAKTDDSGAARLDKKRASVAADSVGHLRTALKSWFGFYNAYDPLFTWWIGEPYKELDQALQGYATFLREHGAKASDAAANADPGGTTSAPALFAECHDVPDLPSLLALPRSEMRGVIERYQQDRGGGRGFSALPVPVKGARSPERTVRTTKLAKDWLAALEKLDFDKLSRTGQIDYLLLRNHLRRDLARLELAAKEPAAKEPAAKEPAAKEPAAKEPAEAKRVKDDSGISGTPIGRDALLVELAGEMIPYSPEELVAIANEEFA